MIVLLAGTGVEFFTPGTSLSGFLLIPVLASVALGRPVLTAVLTFIALLLAAVVQWRLGYEGHRAALRLALIGASGIVGVVLAANLARATRGRAEALATSRLNTGLLRSVADGLIDPLVLLEAVRDSGGRVVDFVYRELNKATCDYLGRPRHDLLGHTLLGKSPGLAEAGLFAEYVRCLDTGEPVVIDDLSYDNEMLAGTRRYDLRATRATPDAISLTWRDVTERFRLARLLTKARDDARYHRLTDNSGISRACSPLTAHSTPSTKRCVTSSATTPRHCVRRPGKS